MDIQKARNIKALMVQLGITQTFIAAELGVSIVYVHHVIHGKRKGLRVREAIAAAVGKTVDELWPPTSPPSPLRSRRGETEGRGKAA